MCGRFPEAPVILDHVGGVRLRDDRIDPAELEGLTALARHPRVYVKLGPIHALGGGGRPSPAPNRCCAPWSPPSAPTAACGRATAAVPS